MNAYIVSFMAFVLVVLGAAPASAAGTLTMCALCGNFSLEPYPVLNGLQISQDGSMIQLELINCAKKAQIVNIRDDEGWREYVVNPGINVLPRSFPQDRSVTIWVGDTLNSWYIARFTVPQPPTTASVTYKRNPDMTGAFEWGERKLGVLGV